MQQGSSSGAGDSGGMFTGLEGGDRSSVKSTNAPALPALRLAAAGKKAKGAAQGYSPPPPMPPPMSPKCQVEGCDLDLKGAKSYYCRHKVCGMHSKSPKVIVAGLEQRFCQQCSRFHLLKEFDQGKRSCRRRLAGHNERRRKPPPPELLPSHFDQLPSFPDVNSNCHGGYVLNFIQPGPPEITRANTLWPSRRSGDLFSGSALALGNCIAGVSDSACALSLLSDQLLGESPDSISSPIDPQPPVIVPSRDAASRHQEARSNSSHEVGLRPPVQDADEIDQFAGIDVASIDVASIDVASIDVASEVYDHLHDFHWLL